MILNWSSKIKVHSASGQPSFLSANFFRIY